MSFFFNDTATTEIYTLSLHDALPISTVEEEQLMEGETYVDFFNTKDEMVRLTRLETGVRFETSAIELNADRKSTRLNSSHANISYAVFCLKKKNTYISSKRLNKLKSS